MGWDSPCLKKERPSGAPVGGVTRIGQVGPREGGLGSGLGEGSDSALTGQVEPRGAGSGRVGPSRAEWGWGRVGHALVDRPSGAAWGRVGPSRAE